MCLMATPAFICDAVRSPFSGDGDAVLPVRANDLGATPLKELMTRNPQPTVCSTSTSPMAPGRRSANAAALCSSRSPRERRTTDSRW